MNGFYRVVLKAEPPDEFSIHNGKEYAWRKGKYVLYPKFASPEEFFDFINKKPTKGLKISLCERSDANYYGEDPIEVNVTTRIVENDKIIPYVPGSELKGLTLTILLLGLKKAFRFVRILPKATALFQEVGRLFLFDDYLVDGEVCVKYSNCTPYFGQKNYAKLWEEVVKPKESEREIAFYIRKKLKLDPSTKREKRDYLIGLLAKKGAVKQSSGWIEVDIEELVNLLNEGVEYFSQQYLKSKYGAYVDKRFVGLGYCSNFPAATADLLRDDDIKHRLNPHRLLRNVSFVFRMKPVRDFRIPKDVIEFFEILGEFGGFTATMLYDAARILENMIKDEGSTNFLAFPACIIATGCRGAIKELVRRKRFDVIITTCGTLDHDLARAFADYYHGTFFVDDRELREKGIHRLGNVFIPIENYGPTIEKHMREILKNLESKEIATYELAWEIGRYIGEHSERREESILYRAYKHKIPVIVPGITDGAVGYQVRLYSQMHPVKIDVLKDESLLDEIVHSSERTGAFIIGGGISKHHVIRRNQFKGGLDRAVYVTTAVERDGSLSGARTREAISRGKVREQAKHVTVPGEATVIVPLLVWYLSQKLTSF